MTRKVSIHPGNSMLSHAHQNGGSAKQAKVLLVFHREESQAGAIGQWLRRHGYELDIRRPRYGDPLPQTLDQHVGVIVFGGPMSANDSEAYIRAEINWLSVPLRENKPLLGICLGAQMLAKHLGAEVSRHPDLIVEVGYYPIEPSGCGASLVGLPAHVYQWHEEGFTMPGGASKLAGGQVFENQAFLYGENAYGVQFHPEMTLAMIHSWTVRAAHRLAAPGARPRAEHLLAHHRHGPALRLWLHNFMRHWLGMTG